MSMKSRLLLVLLFLPSFVFSQKITITMERVGGVYKVPCEINGARMKFIFDTGAAMISLSSEMAEYLLDNNYLTEEDFEGTSNFQDASGHINEMLIANIRDLSIGGLHVHNVKASISLKQNVPLLLGISAIEKLGKVTIKGNLIIIENENNIYRGDDKNISFMGLKQFSYYDDCFETMANKYGEDNLYDSSLNDKITTITVEDAPFMEKCFSNISLAFDDDLLQSVICEKIFDENEVSNATRFYDDIYKVLHEKYTESSSKEVQNNEYTYKHHYMGYVKRSDANLYPIKLVLTRIDRTFSSRDMKAYTETNYVVKLTYWPKSYDMLIEKYPVEDEY